jgi:nucleoside 2-deoxyribosyltransferase
MAKAPRIAFIGNVCLDVTLTQEKAQDKMRLGGIMHAARTLWALDVPYDLAYVAPQYLCSEIDLYARSHGASNVCKIGTVNGAPNVALIAEPTESGSQGYEILMRDAYKADIKENDIQQIISNSEVTDILIFPGEYDLKIILGISKLSSAKVHIDIANGVSNLDILRELGRKFDTGILSTSSFLFSEDNFESIPKLCDHVMDNYFNDFILKENRGGSRMFCESDRNVSLNVPAQVRPITHSVGVGDCYDAVYVTLAHKFDKNAALHYASWISAEYASTTYPDNFKDISRKILKIEPQEIQELGGTFLPWEARTKVNLYIAAPDFDYINRASINKVVDCLLYHNFKPRLPIRENGQLSPNADYLERQRVYESDIRLLLECQIVLAVMVYDDPGTIFEIGFAVGIGIPVVIYDPDQKVINPMLSQSVSLISSNLDEVIAYIFELASKRR